MSEGGAAAPAAVGEWAWLQAPGAARTQRGGAPPLAGAALVCMLLPPPPADGGAAYVELLHTLTDGLPPTVLCKSGGDPVMTFEI